MELFGPAGYCRFKHCFGKVTKKLKREKEWIWKYQRILLSAFLGLLKVGNSKPFPDLFNYTFKHETFIIFKVKKWSIQRNVRKWSGPILSERKLKFKSRPFCLDLVQILPIFFLTSTARPNWGIWRKVLNLELRRFFNKRRQHFWLNLFSSKVGVHTLLHFHKLYNLAHGKMQVQEPKICISTAGCV